MTARRAARIERRALAAATRVLEVPAGWWRRPAVLAGPAVMLAVVRRLSATPAPVIDSTTGPASDAAGPAVNRIFARDS